MPIVKTGQIKLSLGSPDELRKFYDIPNLRFG
jgi:hypothetical protein